MDDTEKAELIRIATHKMLMRIPQNVVLSLPLDQAIGIIGQLQLAFRHPQNTGFTRQTTEEIVRELINEIDPTKGEIYQLLMLGFNPECNEKC